MEQATQQINQKPSFPIKTKIAAWWMMVLGVIGMIVGVGSTVGPLIFLSTFFIKLEVSFSEILKTFLSSEAIYYFIFAFLASLLSFISGLYLLKRKKQSWWWAIIAIFIGLIVSILSEEEIYMATENILVLIIPLVLLISDRKNFFKIAS